LLPRLGLVYKSMRGMMIGITVAVCLVTLSMLKLFINNGFLKSIKYAKIITRKKTQSYLKNFNFSIETFHQKLLPRM
jgi:hypothetical protein